jgi:hypothetical protein
MTWATVCGLAPHSGQLVGLRGWKRAVYSPMKAWAVMSLIRVAQAVAETPRVREECSISVWVEKATAMQVEGIWLSLRLWLVLDPRVKMVRWSGLLVRSSIVFAQIFLFVVMSDAVVGYKATVGEVEVPRWGGEEVDVGWWGGLL